MVDNTNIIDIIEEWFFDKSEDNKTKVQKLNKEKGKPRVILLDEFSPTMIEEPTMFAFSRISIELAKRLIHNKYYTLVSFIRYETTAQLISKIFNINVNVNKDMYKFQKGDILLIFTLKKTPEDIKTVNSDDIIITQIIPFGESVVYFSF